ALALLEYLERASDLFALLLGRRGDRRHPDRARRIERPVAPGLERLDELFARVRAHRPDAARHRVVGRRSDEHRRGALRRSRCGHARTVTRRIEGFEHRVEVRPAEPEGTDAGVVRMIAWPRLGLRLDLERNLAERDVGARFP